MGGFEDNAARAGEPAFLDQDFEARAGEVWDRFGQKSIHPLARGVGIGDDGDRSGWLGCGHPVTG